MLTYEKVFEIFRKYLAVDKEVEVIQSSRGYVRIEWAGTAPYCEDGRLCRTPEELFDQLLSDYQGYQENLLTKGRIGRYENPNGGTDTGGVFQSADGEKGAVRNLQGRPQRDD